MSLIVVITNDGTGPDHAASYRWEVRVNEQPIDWGTVSGHDRRDDWRKLVKRVIEAPGVWQQVILGEPNDG